MTKEELALLRAKMRAEALETLLEWLAQVLGDWLSLQESDVQSRSLSAVARKLLQRRTEFLTIGFPGLSPEMSDLRAAEFQEAFDYYAKQLEHILKNPQAGLSKYPNP